MTIFVIFRVSHPDILARELSIKYPNDHLKVSDGQWLLSARGTAREVAEYLGFINQGTTSGIVISMGSYWGRAPTDIWDWIKAKAEAGP